MGIGTIKIKLANGDPWVLNEDRNILNLKRNLILISKLDKEVYIFAFKNH